MKSPAFSRSLFMTVFSLAWPTMLEQLMQTAVQYMDTAMVGALGMEATAAVGATTTVNWLIGSSISALGVGFLSYIAQAEGAGERQRARLASAQIVLAALLCGTVFTLLTLALSPVIPVWMQVRPSIRAMASRYFFILYLPMLPRTALILFGTVLRAAGDSRTPMRVGLLVNAVNVVGNLFLIFPSRTVFGFLPLPGAGLGVAGAAWASAAAYTLGGLLITAALWHHKTVSPAGLSIRPDFSVLRPCLRVALPNMLQRFAVSFGYVVFASMINSLGEVSAAAHTIANTVESAFYIPGYGMQTAAATLIGNACGAGDRPAMDRLTGILLWLETLLMAASGTLLFILAPEMMSLFSRDAAVIVLGTAVLRMVAVSEPVYGVTIVMEGMLQGLGDTAAPFLYHLLGMWGIRITGTFLCTRLLSMGLVSAWACMIAHNVLLFILFTAHVRKKWKKPLPGTIL